MIKLSDKDSALKAEELEKIIEAMSGLHSSKLKGLKKGAPAAMSVEVLEAKPIDEADEGGFDLGKDDEASESPEHEASETPEEEALEHADEPSEGEKAKIAALYNRYCR